MKRGTPHHFKTRRLARLLGIPRGYAVGILEGLWHCAARYTPQGDIGKMANEEIAEEIGYEGDADHLVKCLADAGWVDHCDLHRLIIHDWNDHAEAATKKYLKDNNLDFYAPTRQGSKQVETSRDKCAQVETSSDSLGHTRPEPEPEPEAGPEPKPLPITPSVSAADAAVARRGVCTNSQAEAIYRCYPRKAKKPQAIKAIKSAVKKIAKTNDDPITWLIQRTQAFAESPRGQAPTGGSDYRQHPATWFNSEGYNDDSEWQLPNGDEQPRKGRSPLDESARDPHYHLESKTSPEAVERMFREAGLA